MEMDQNFMFYLHIYFHASLAQLIHHLKFLQVTKKKRQHQNLIQRMMMSHRHWIFAAHASTHL